jgi:RNA polymerase sigma factor (sigma-70 family)
VYKIQLFDVSLLMELTGVQPGIGYHWRRLKHPMRDPGSARHEDAADAARPRIAPPEQERTVELLERARTGDSSAIDALFRRCLPVLTRWARGRLPAHARDLKETQDLVQETLIDALRNLPRFEQRGDGALQAYLRQAVNNRIKDEIRRVRRRPTAVALVDQHADPAASPLEQVVGLENVERYESALQRLRSADRELVVARLEMQCSYEELAVYCSKPSANAARVAVIRAVYRLAKELEK